ncbi:MAG: septum formation initiator family protein [Akkermansia sp.]|nr:septum formation initiator family protein [Akkermansia sp.]
MKLPLLRRSYPTLDELDAIRARRTAGISHVLGVTALIFLGFVAFLASMLVLKPLLELQKLRQLKEHTEYQLQRARAEEAEAQNIYMWMTSDPEFYEQLARDRADMAKEGEIIIRRPTPADIRQQQYRANKQRKQQKN